MARKARGIVMVDALLAVAVLGAGLGGLLRLMTATWSLQADTWARFEARLAAQGALAGRPPGGASRFRVEARPHPRGREFRIYWDRREGQGGLELPGRGPGA